jgi:hypothetical protein
MEQGIPASLGHLIIPVCLVQLFGRVTSEIGNGYVKVCATKMKDPIVHIAQGFNDPL